MKTTEVFQEIEKKFRAKDQASKDIDAEINMQKADEPEEAKQEEAVEELESPVFNPMKSTKQEEEDKKAH